jgi:hypothetical protein
VGQEREQPASILRDIYYEHHIMSIFEHDNYDIDYQRYLEFKSEQEEQAQEMQEYLEWEEARQKADDERAERYLDDVEVANELGVIHEEEEEEDTHQLAQITVNGIFRYEFEWLPETSEVRVEVDTFRNGDPMYYRYPDAEPITKTIASLLGCDEKEVKLDALGIFGGDREGMDVNALPYELECFRKSTWHDYAAEGYIVQFNINTFKEEIGTCGHAEDDETCSPYTCGRRMTKSAFIRRLEEVRQKSSPTQHGLEGTQCDCSECERANEMPEDMEPYHESVDENRLPTVYECLSLPKRILDALIRNWVASQPDEEKAVKEATDLSEAVRKIAKQL